MEAKSYNNKKVSVTERRFRDYKFNGSVFTTRMDPSAAASRYPVSYPIVSDRHNASIGIEYKGPETDSDNVAAIASLYRDGPLYHAFDAIKYTMGINYLGLAAPGNFGSMTVPTDALNAEYNKDVVRNTKTAIAAGFATQFTDLGFLKTHFQTNMPGMAGSATETEIGDEALVGALVTYQAIQQNKAIITGNYNTLMKLNDHLINMGYNAEAPSMIRLLNLFKKSNVFSILNQLGSQLFESYLDLDWYKELGVIINVPSRKYNDMLSPFKSISGFTRIPTLKMSRDGVDILDMTSEDWTKIPVSMNQGANLKYFTLESLFYHVIDLLNPVTILEWARKDYNNALPSWFTAEYYINDFLASLTVLVKKIGQLDAAFVDLTTFLMVLQNETGLNNWVIHSPITKPSRPREQTDPVDFEPVNDIIAATYSGGNAIAIDYNTRKWRSYTLWDYESGIPNFDFYEGGLAIAASVASHPTVSADDSLSPYYMIPILFTPSPTIIQYPLNLETGSSATTSSALPVQPVILNRKGVTARVAPQGVSMSVIRSSVQLSRIDLTNLEDNVTMRMPYVYFNINSEATPVNISNMIRFCFIVFGCCGAVQSNTIMWISPSVVGIVSREFGDFAERSHDYIVGRSPLRLSGDPQSLGFTFRFTNPGGDGREKGWKRK